MNSKLILIDLEIYLYYSYPSLLFLSSNGIPFSFFPSPYILLVSLVCCMYSFVSHPPTFSFNLLLIFVCMFVRVVKSLISEAVVFEPIRLQVM